MKNKLTLEGLQRLKKLNGFIYHDLLVSRRRRFGRKTLRSIELTENASWSVRKDLFDRINTKPYDLTPMEIRKGLIDEKFYNFLNDCSKNPLFTKLCPISKIKLKREVGAEMVLRYFAYSANYKNFIHRVDEFVDESLIKIIGDNNIGEMKADFGKMLNFVDKFFPLGFKKIKNSKSTPMVRYEAIAVGVHLALQVKPNLKPKLVENWINSKEFNIHNSSDAANNRLKVIGRFEYVRDKLLGK